MKKNNTIPRIITVILGVILLSLAGFLAFRMYTLHNAEELWGYIPLVQLLSAWIGGWLLFFGKSLIDKSTRNRIGLLYLSAILMSLGFPPFPFTFLLHLGLVPFFIYLHLLEKDKSSWKKIFAGSFHFFIIWNILTTYWVCNTAYAAGIVANAANSAIMAIVVLIFSFLSKNKSVGTKMIMFSALWLSFEFIHHRWEILWPWLTLGNGLSRWPILAQWYEFTGTPGGTLWILLVNWLVFSFWKNRNKMSLYTAVGMLVIPVIISVSIYFFRNTNYTKQVNIAVIQPNFEPHFEKFNVPEPSQMERFLGLSQNVVNEETDILLFPETSISVNLNSWSRNRSVRMINTFLDEHPDLHLIMGTASRRILDEGEDKKPVHPEHI